MNPLGNDGNIFDIPSFSGNSCTLDIDFDYLFKIDCATLVDMATGAATSYNEANLGLQNQIVALEIQIEQQYVTCETIANEIAYNQSLLTNIFDSTTINQIQVVINSLLLSQEITLVYKLVLTLIGI